MIWRVARAGLVAALLVGLVGRVLEQVRFGAPGEDRQDAFQRVQAELRQRLDASADLLGTIAGRLILERDAIRGAPRDPTRDTAAARRLFDAADTALRDVDIGRTGVTIYDNTGDVPLAWAGHVSELPKDRRAGP